jgi:hypothetical protein
MNPHLHPSRADEPESPLTGMFEVTLTRAVLPYRDPADRALPGGRMGDIGLGVVVDGSNPARSDVVDLGSAERRSADLTGPLVVLGWLYPSGLRSLERVVSNAESGEVDRQRAQAFTFSMARRVLEGAGFTSLTRPIVLRIGFRDLCRDLDLHEGTALRLMLPSETVARIHLDYDDVNLVVRTGRSSRDPELESALSDAFPGRKLLRGTLGDPAGTQTYHVPLPVPRVLSQARALLGKLRRGLVHMLARFEPERYRSLRDLTRTFGERDSLRTLKEGPDATRLEPVVTGRGSGRGLRGIH